jgi:hypothetical protein
MLWTLRDDHSRNHRRRVSSFVKDARPQLDDNFASFGPKSPDARLSGEHIHLDLKRDNLAFSAQRAAFSYYLKARVFICPLRDCLIGGWKISENGLWSNDVHKYGKPSALRY